MQFLLKQVLKREPDSPKELKEQAKILRRYFASVQGAESPKSGAYCLYVSTEDDESNAEMTYKSKQKRCYRFGNTLLHTAMLFPTSISGIPTLALSKSGSRSKVTPSSQPVLRAPFAILLSYSLYSHYEMIARAYAAIIPKSLDTKRHR